ncbi:hypothetical protein ACP4OV_028528 [Aristida adscensionis]
MDMKPAASCSALLLLFMLLLPCSSDVSSKVYIVYMGEKKHNDPSVVTASHHRTLTSVLGSEDEARKSIIYSYKHGFSGFAAKLTESQANELRSNHQTYINLQTTRSWDFLGQNYYKPSGLLKKANHGKDIIVGVVDTGIWPESRSFDDRGYGPVPRRWKGVCQAGDAFNATGCNRKIIGARWYVNDTTVENLWGEHLSPRDFHGHGTHCASTIAGVPVQNASHGGWGKACWGKAGSCATAALVAAIDDAINDGVDVLSLSVRLQVDIPGTLHAVARGITVVFAAGNDGPVAQSMHNSSPWVITVAASTIDRSFPAVISLGDGQKLVGCARLKSEDVNATGYIILCFTPPNGASPPPSDVLYHTLNVAVNARAKGIIFAQYTTNLGTVVLQMCNSHHMPCVVVDYDIGYSIHKYWDASSVPVAKISPAVTVVGDRVLSPSVAMFSSRGPSLDFPAILKPDIAAPGVAILAAKGNSYEFSSGTSTACPHVSAVVALLKAVHTDWSPAMIKSAIVTTASVTDRWGIPIQAEGAPRKLSNPFDFGGGHIDPDRAIDPGLIYNIDPKEYMKFFNCTLGPKDDCSDYMGNLYQLNLPSIVVPNLKDSVTICRSVTNVGPVKATYRARIEAPTGVTISVEPSEITFKKDGPRSVTFKVTLEAKQRLQGVYTFGSLTWFDGHTHSVRIPIAVRTIIQDFISDTS